MDNALTSAGFPTPAAARIIPFAVFMMFVGAQSLGHDWLLSTGLDARWVYPARTVAVALALLVLWRHYSELHNYAGVTARRAGIAFIAGIAMFSLWINLNFEWVTFGKHISFDPTLADGTGIDWALVCFRLIGLAVVVPIMEELFWRSFLLRWLDQHDFLNYAPGRVSIRAMLLCAVLFASEHSFWFAGLLAGLVYGLVYVRSGNLWLPILSHAVTNAALGLWILATGNWQFW